jgi:hypothetical protein
MTKLQKIIQPFLKALGVLVVMNTIAFGIAFLWTGTIAGAAFFEYIFFAPSSLVLATPRLYRHFRDQKAIPSIDARTVATSALAYSLSGALGACVGAAVFYVLFFFPTWIWNPDVMLLWGWFGTPLGAVCGVICFVRITDVLGRKLVNHLNP